MCVGCSCVQTHSSSRIAGHQRPDQRRTEVAGPNGAAPNSHHAAIWGALLDLRGIRDTVEIAVGKMTAKLDALGEATDLQVAVEAGYGWAAGDAADEIVALINASPCTPRADEIAAIIARAAAPACSAKSPLLTRVREITARIAAAEKIADGAAADAAITKAQEELQELDAQIPRPPRSFADLVARAQVAYAGGEARHDGTLAEAEAPDIFEGPAARLVEDVLQFASGQR